VRLSVDEMLFGKFSIGANGCRCRTVAGPARSPAQRKLVCEHGHSTSHAGRQIYGLVPRESDRQKHHLLEFEFYIGEASA
jgi:hypothetical protein